MAQTNVDEYTRPRVDFKDCTDSDKLDYTAGLIDTDGSIGTKCDIHETSISLSIAVSQALLGWKCLEFLYDTFGGAIYLQLRETETTQRAYNWTLTKSENIQKLLNLIVDRLSIKRREALVALEFPLGHIKIVPIRATHKETGEVLMFGSAKDVGEFLNRKQIYVPKDKCVEVDNYVLQTIISDKDIEKVLEKRLYVRQQLKKFHSEPHNPIPNSYVLTIPYVAGVIDGEANLDANGKSSMFINVTQKYEPLLRILQRFGGKVLKKKKEQKWDWTIRMCDNAHILLKNVYPYLHGKKEQANMIINMKPGEAPIIHAKLREMKAYYFGNTSRIDKIKNNDSSIEYKTPPKKLPRGVHELPSKRYKALLGIDKKYYSLGVFDTIEEAKAQYDEYKKKSQLQKNGKQTFDWAKFSRVSNTVRLPKPEQHREKCIYNTASHTYQVRIRKKDLGTYESLDEAKRVRDRELIRINEEENQAFGESLKSETKNIYPDLKKDGKTVYRVKIGGNSYGTFSSVQDAMKVRNEILIHQRNDHSDG